MIRFRYLVRTCLFIITSSIFAVDVLSTESNEPNLSLSIICPKENIKQGDEIPIIFTITNKGNSHCDYFHDENLYRERICEQYRIISKYEDGTKVEDPFEYLSYGYGLLPPSKSILEPGQTYKKTAILNDWAVIRKPGRYIVTGFYYKLPYPLVSENDYIFSNSIEIVVEPRTDRQMSDYLNELSGKLKSDYMTEVMKSEKEGDRYIDTVRKLIYTCDPCIVPLLLETLYKNEYDASNRVCLLVYRAFLYYLPRDDGIIKQIIEAAKNRGLVPGMGRVLEELGCDEEKLEELIQPSLFSNDAIAQSGAIEVFLEHPSDEYASQLVTIAQDPNHPAQYLATLALAFHRTDEGVAALKKMLGSSDELTRNSANLAIELAYKRMPRYPETVNQEFTAKLIPFAKDFSNPKCSFAIGVLIRTRTKEGVEVIRSLLSDPNIDVPLAERDEGIKTIKELLNHKNENIRRETRNIIEYTFGLTPGRPLKKEDFPEIYEKSLKYETNHKKRVLGIPKLIKALPERSN